MLVTPERDGNNLAHVTYTRGNDLSGTLQGAGGIGGLLARSEMSNLQSPHAYYHADGNGNITALVDTNGIIVARYQYDPYGNLLGMSGPLADANSYRFSSKEWCANAGLYYYGFRYYEPNLQRWPNRDPFGEWGGLNLYQFVANSPLYYVDPYGLHWTDYVPNWIFPAASFSAGMGDALTFNLTDHARNWMDINQVNHCSGWYKGGEVAGKALSFALPAGGVSKVAGGADRALIGTAESGIYRFAGRTGRNYIGQSGDIATRLGRHASTGKLPPGVNPTTWEVWGGKLARERAEQQLINKEGLRNLENIVNPLGGRPGLYHYVPTVGEAAGAGAAIGAGVGALKGGGCNE